MSRSKEVYRTAKGPNDPFANRDEYRVQSIKACATRCGLPTYLIRWAGLGEHADTYELELNVKRQDNWADIVKEYKLRARQFLEVSSLPR